MIPTPWIKAYDPAQEFLGGYSQGAQVAEANARMAQAAQQHAQQIQHAAQQLQQQQHEAQMRHEIEQQRLEQNSRIEQQQLEISRAYHDAQIGMQQQRLQEAKVMNDQRIKQYADMAAGRMEISKRVAAGEDFDKVMMEVGPRAFGNSSSAVSSAMRIAERRQAPPPQWTQPNEETGAPGYMTDSKGNVHFAPSGRRGSGKEMDEFDKEKFETAKAEIKKLQDKVITDGLSRLPKKLKENMDQQEPFKAELNKIAKKYGRIGGDLPYPGIETSNTIGSYDADGNFVPAKKAEKKEDTSFVSDVWKAIKGAVTNKNMEEEEDPNLNIIPQAPVIQ